jgi:hypothetical protein
MLISADPFRRLLTLLTQPARRRHGPTGPSDPPDAPVSCVRGPLQSGSAGPYPPSVRRRLDDRR